jgi:hypothetical protein
MAVNTVKTRTTLIPLKLFAFLASILKKKTIVFWFNGSSKTNGVIYEILCDHDNWMLTSNGWL